MTEIITSDILDDFERLTAYDVKSFLQDYLTFIDSHYSNITNFFSGATNVNPTESFNFLKDLIERQKKIIDVTILNSNSLNNYQYWALLEYIEDIGHSLETANNASRWLRSSITSDGYKQTVLNDYMASQGQDLQSIERDVIKSDDSRNTWVDTALQNQLREEDYSQDGGYLIKVIYKNNASLFLNGVVDNIDTPEKTYGLDIDKRITFENDDIVVLGYRDTIEQCMKILTDLGRGDDPAFPDRGLNRKALLGGSLAGISYPTIFRDLAANFATDDSFKSFQITDIRNYQDAVYVDFKVETKAGDFFTNSSQL